MTSLPHPFTAPEAVSDQRLQRLGSFLRMDPDNATLLRDYAGEAFRAKEFIACALAIEQLTKLGVASLPDHLLRARALRFEGQTDQALSSLRQAQAEHPDDPAIALERASIHLADHAYEAALEALPTPSLPETLSAELAAEVCAMRLRLLHHLGRIDEANALGEAACLGQARPPEAVVKAWLPVLIDAFRLEDAQRLAQALISQATDPATVPYEACEPLAAAALQAGDLPAAHRWTRQALTMRQDDGRIWLLQGLSELQMNAPAEAIASLQQAARRMSGHPGTQVALGWAHLLQQDLDAAQSAFEAAAELSPSFSEVHGSLAAVAAMRGQQDLAVHLLRKARRLDPHCASALWAEHRLSGSTAPDQLNLIADQVISLARRQLRPAVVPQPHSA